MPAKYFVNYPRGGFPIPTDVTPPNIPLGLTTSNVSSSSVTLQGIIPSDPSPAGAGWTGTNQIEILRNNTHLTFVSVGAGNQPSLTFTDLGGPFTPASAISQNGPDISFTTVAKDHPYPTVDGRAIAYQLLAGTSWWAWCRIDSFVAADQFSNIGLRVSADLTSTSKFVELICFPFAQGQGVLSKARTTVGGNDTNIQQVTGVAAPAYLFVNRVNDTYFLYYSADGNALTTIGSANVTLGSSAYVCAFATSDDGVSISGTVKQLSIQTLGTWTFVDNTVIAGNNYTYTIRAIDGANNNSAIGNGVTVHIPSSVIQFTPGLWREDQAMQYGFGAQHRPFSDLTNAVNSAVTVGFVPNIPWGAMENNFGQYDFTVINDLWAPLKNAGKKVMILLHAEAVPFVSQANTFAQNYLPPYLNDASGANVYGSALNIYFGNTYGGTVCCFNRTAVLNRVIALYQALANFVPTGETAPLSSNPVFEGIIFQETAYFLGTGGQVTNNYDGLGSQTAWDNAYCANYVTLVQQARSIFPNKCMGFRANWGTNANMIAIATACKNNACMLDNTDGVTDYSAMDDVIENKSIIQPNSSALGDLRGVIPLMCFSESVGQDNDGFGITAAHLVAYATNTPGSTRGGPWKCNYLIPSRNSQNTSDPTWTNSPWNAIETAYTNAGGVSAFNTKPSTYP